MSTSPPDNKEARALLEKAAKAQSRLFSFGTAKYEEAAELYVRAGNLFKASKQFQESADAYLEAAAAYTRAGSDMDAGRQKIAAGMVLKKVDPKRAAELMLEGVQPQVASGHFTAAAKSMQEAGEMFEKEDDPERAVECYRTAAEYYEMENSVSRSNAILLKIAQLQATSGKYDEAIEIYEKVSEASLQNNLLKYSVRDYLFKAMICQFAKDDTIGARRKLEKYEEMDPTFAAQREGKLCEKILDACEAYDVDAFTAAVAEYDAITPLDAFKTSVLLKVKNTIMAAHGGGDSLC